MQKRYASQDEYVPAPAKVLVGCFCKGDLTSHQGITLGLLSSTMCPVASGPGPFQLALTNGVEDGGCFRMESITRSTDAADM